MNEDNIALDEVREVDYEVSPAGNLVLYVSDAILTQTDEDGNETTIHYRRQPPAQRIRIEENPDGEE